MKFRICLAAMAVTAMGTLAAEAQQAKQLSIATGGTGGVYYPLAGGFGSILSKEIPGVTATAEVTGGSLDNMKLVGSGNADIAFTQVDTAVDAVAGRDKFPKKLPIRALVVMYPNLMQVVTLEGNGITNLDGPQGQAPVDRRAGQRHGDFCPAHHRGGRARQGQGHVARTAERSRVRQCAEG